MGVMRKALILAIAAGALAVSGSRNGPITVGPRGELSPQALYSKYSKEHYLSTEDFAYIRPGYHIKVNSLTIPADLKPLADVSFTDDLGQPLDRNGLVTPGTLSASMVLAWYDGTTRNYTSYTTRIQTSAPPSTMPGVQAVQAAADSGGTWTDLAVGHSTYKFKTALPAAFDKTKTTTLAIYGTRSTVDIVGKNYYANAEYDFRPDGNAITESWDMIRNDACNTCHNPLSAHGGSRQDVKLCVTCHSPQTTDPDTGRTVDFKVMIHKIHYGENLPSVQAGGKYQIIGFQQSVNDYSTVAFPADTRNCTFCHDQNNGAAQAKAFLNPSRDACGSCHDNVNFATGENHSSDNLPEVSDNQCGNCHTPQGELEFDASILGAHTIHRLSSSLPGTVFNLVKVENAAPGKAPTVTFGVKDKAGNNVAVPAMDRLALVVAGPTADYAGYVSEDPRKTAVANGDGTYKYTFTKTLPANATGTYSIGIEGYRNEKLLPGTKKEITVRDAGANQVISFSVDGSTVAPRRTVVAIDNCNQCHSSLSVHGDNRNQIVMCVLCHNPNTTDADMRTAGNQPPQTVDFRTMIHKIHRGENLDPNDDYTIIGFGKSVNNFNQIRFPGDLRNCEKCHVNASEQLPLKDNLLNVVTPRGYMNPTTPTAAACLACHDDKPAASHALGNTTTLGEACSVCHSPDAQFAIDKVHAR